MIMSRPKSFATFAALFLIASLGGLASADQPAPEATSAAIMAKPVDAERAKAEECRAFAKESKIFVGMIKNDLRPIIQEEDASLTMRNKKHVVAAYAILWILSLGFLALMFVRQRRLIGRIDTLRAEVAAAAEDDE